MSWLWRARQWASAIRKDKDLSPAARILGLTISTQVRITDGMAILTRTSRYSRMLGMSGEEVQDGIEELLQGGYLLPAEYHRKLISLPGVGWREQ